MPMIKIFQMINTNSYYVRVLMVKYIFLYWLLKLSVILSHYLYNKKKLFKLFKLTLVSEWVKCTDQLIICSSINFV